MEKRDIATIQRIAELLLTKNLEDHDKICNMYSRMESREEQLSVLDDYIHKLSQHLLARQVTGNYQCQTANRGRRGGSHRAGRGRQSVVVIRQSSQPQVEPFELPGVSSYFTSGYPMPPTLGDEIFETPRQTTDMENIFSFLQLEYKPPTPLLQYNDNNTL